MRKLLKKHIVYHVHVYIYIIIHKKTVNIIIKNLTFSKNDDIIIYFFKNIFLIIQFKSNLIQQF
jgi:hypothetical protein